VEVRKVGRLVPVDAGGFVVRDVSAENIRPPWDAPLRAAVKVILEHWSELVHTVYVRGSVPHGLAVEGVSDVDCYVVVRGSLDTLDRSWISAACEKLDAEFPFQTGIEIQPFSLDALLGPKPEPLYRVIQFSIGTNCVCVYGDDLSPRLPRFKPGREIAVRCANFRRELSEALSELSSHPGPEATRERCAWIMKRLLRTGFEVVMQREQAYTRDLYFCYEAFARHYPEREHDMRRALELALSPSVDAAELQAFLRDLGGWLLERVGEVFPDLIGPRIS